jgi:hypothetical protein
MALKPAEKPRDDEDELDELPPIDGDGEAGDEPEAGPEDLDEETADAGDPLDDSTGEDDPIDEIDVDESEAGWLDDADEDEALDVGAPDALGEEAENGALLEGAEETDVGEDDLTVGLEEETLVGDAGEEGFVDEDEALREEDLPRLDSGDDDTEADDADLGEGLPDEDAPDESLPPWDDRAWDRVEGAAGGTTEPVAAVTALACAESDLFVAGEGIARIDREGNVTALEALGLRGGAPASIVAAREWLALSTPRAGVLVSHDAGRSFAGANDWRACVAPEDAARGQQITALTSLALCGEDLWGCTRGGALVWSADRGATWTRVASEHPIDAISADAATGELVGLSHGEAGSRTIVRGRRGQLASSPCGHLPGSQILSLAASGGSIAVAFANLGAFRLGDAGEWSRLEGTASVTAISHAPGGTVVVALCSEGEGRAWIVEARGGDGPARIVAELGDAPSNHEDEGDLRVRALAWDDSRGVMWAAGAFGLVALRPARR